MWLHASGSNPLSGSIILPSVRPISCPWAFDIFVFVLISSMGFQPHNAFMPTLGSKVIQWGPVEPIYMSISLSIFLVVFVNFWRKFVPPVFARSACTRRRRVP